MLSISFLPWVLLLLALIVSIPTVSYIETSRRKKALAELEAERERERELARNSESEEVVGEGIDDGGTFADAGSFGPSNSFDASESVADPFGDAQFGDNAAVAEFDDDTFK